ncbi:hypothetical protein Plhal703r1_c19g0085391 [Plasmopara halstedii]
MSGFFSDNQTKQKEYDRYYKTMSKSDFVQDRKLKAKGWETVVYEYDQITKKLLKGPKGPPEVIKGEASEIPKSSKKKHTFVPQSTDADANMEEPTVAEESFKDFFSGVNDVAQKVQREFRREDSNRRRQEMAAKLADEVMKESVKLLKRKRNAAPPNKSPTDKRATKKAAKRAEEEPSITRQLFQDSDVNESSDDEKRKAEKRLRGYKSQFAANLYESVRHRFREAVDQRKGKDYFEDNAPKPPRKHKMKRDAMNQYKAEMKGWLDGIFI